MPTTPVPVAIVISSLSPGGTERQMIELARRLEPSRWLVHVVCFRNDGAWFDRTSRALPVVCLPLPSLRRAAALRQARAFARWCRDRRIQVLHASDMPSVLFALPAATLARVPVRIANRREINAHRSIAALAIQRAAYACAHRIVANSRAVNDRLRAELVPARKIAVISNGLAVEVFRRHVARPTPRRVVTVANLRPEKCHDVLIDAAAEVLRRFPDARFEFVGSGPELGTLRERARICGVAHAVAFLGHREDVADRLADADIFVLPSRSEAFPNALLEAMAAGLPVVASAVGGILELVDDGRNGLLVPAGDPRALADRLCRLMAEANLGERLGEQARRHVESRYSFDRMVAAFEKLYIEELARRRLMQPSVPECATPACR